MHAGPSEYVQGLTYEECATLLNVDSANTAIMQEIFDTAFAIKERIYGNRIVRRDLCFKYSPSKALTAAC